MLMDYTEIAYEVADKTATITLDRPQALNAFTNTMLHELLDAFDRVDADDGVRAVIVTGRGRGFCAGADLSSGGQTFDDGGRGEQVAASAPPRDGGGRLTLRIFDCKKPVIAAVNGPAVGVGVTMTLPMDIRIAAESARFGFVFARRGIVPEACSSWFLPRIVGISQATEWVFTGRVFPAAEALDGGLVGRVVPDDELLPTARALAAEIASSTSAVSVALSRQLLWRMLGASHPMEAHRADTIVISMLGTRADGREGVTSFLEKRPANFPGRVSTDLPDLFPSWEEPPYR
ncbi:MAG: crotonase/enoyl-CoA hydratase family protein [Acidimicrobiales bacterium]